MIFFSYILLAFIGLILTIIIIGKINRKTEVQPSEPIPDMVFITNSLRGATIQILETVYILETTVNIDTFASRLRFLKERAKFVSPYANNEVYNNIVSTGLLLYQKQYPNILISELQREILASPLKVYSDDFNATIRTNFFKRYCDRVYNEIKKLKQEAAKEKRRSKVIETAKLILSGLNKSQKNYHQVVVEQLKRFDVTLKIRYEEDK